MSDQTRADRDPRIEAIVKYLIASGLVYSELIAEKIATELVEEIERVAMA